MALQYTQMGPGCALRAKGIPRGDLVASYPCALSWATLLHLLPSAPSRGEPRPGPSTCKQGERLSTGARRALQPCLTGHSLEPFSPSRHHLSQGPSAVPEATAQPNTCVRVQRGQGGKKPVTPSPSQSPYGPDTRKSGRM